MAAVEMEVQARSGTSLESIPVVYNDSAYRMITPQVREVLDGVLRVMLAQIREEAVKPERVEVYGTPDYDEMKGNVIVRVWTEMGAEPASALWDRLADAVQAWTETLPKPQADIAYDLIGTEVHWSVDTDGF